jgi:hypothetical protein
MEESKWTKDLFAEKQMKRMGVKHTIEKVDLQDIDWEKSKENHGRMICEISNEVVEDMAGAMRSGSKFPMAVLLRTGKRYVIYGGKHRLMGSNKNGDKSVDAYVFTSNDDIVLSNLPSALNATATTLAVTREHRILFACSAVSDTGLPILEAEALYGISSSTITTRIRTELARAELEQTGFQYANKISAAHIEHLKHLAPNANVQKKTAELIYATRSSSEDTKRIVEDIRKVRTEASQIARIEHLEKEMLVDQQKPTGCTVRVRKPGAEILRAITTLENLAHVKTINNWGITDRTERSNIRERIQTLVVRLERICKQSN